MRIVVADLPPEGLHLSGVLDLELEADPGPDELRLEKPLEYDLEVRRQGKRVRVEGSVAATVLALCSRCARRYPLAIERRFTAIYEAAAQNGGGKATELDEDDLALDYYEGDAIDGRTLLAEQVLLALPMKLICTEDCRGLCPRCGANLNETDCNCEKDVDPRLASLKALRDRL